MTRCPVRLRVAVALLAVLAAICLSGCRSSQQQAIRPPVGTPAPSTDEGEALQGDVIVFAAASLADSLDTLAAVFKADHPGVRAKCTYDGTQFLRTQVEQGAQPDVFASANIRHMEALVEQGLVKEAQVFAASSLCVAAALDGDVTTLCDLAQPGVRLVVATETCPAGAYTRDCWQKMARSSEFGPGFVAAMKDNVVSEETNVKLVLAKVELGEADVAFVYTSDIDPKKAVALPLPSDVSMKAIYQVGLGAEARNEAAARAFIAVLRAPRGARALAEQGLTPLHAEQP